MTMQKRFDAANTSHDGKLTLNQAKAAAYTRVANNFDAIDTSKKGYVTVEDIRAYNRAQRAAKRAAKTEPRPRCLPVGGGMAGARPGHLVSRA